MTTPASNSILEPELVTVPAGRFIMGTTQEAVTQAGFPWSKTLDDETPQQTLTLPTYQIGHYPVTNAQYKQFIRETGASTPSYWGTPDDFPVSGVSWYEAVAYCRWLAETTGKPYTLPSEAEWEKAARGPDGYLWPWGNAWDAKHYEVRGRGKTRFVGCTSKLGSDSPCGAADMIGNVWEWTRSVHRPYPYDPENPEDSPAAAMAALDHWLARADKQTASAAPRVYRGCPQHCQEIYTRATVRGAYNPAHTRGSLGFRVALPEG